MLFSGQPFDVAGRMRLSDAKNFFDCKRYTDWKKWREHEHRVQSAVVDRLNGVIESISALGKRL